MRLSGRKSFIALSLVGMLTPLGAQENGFDNTNDPKKEVTVGTATGGDKLVGNIKTDGQGSKTVVHFLGSSSMEGGQISASATNGGQGAGGAGAINEVHLEGNSVLKLTASAANGGGAGGGAGAITPAYSILAQNKGAQNIISDITTGTATGSIAGAISALSGGVNTIFNLRNHDVSGPIIAAGEGSKNDIKFDSGTTFKSYISAINGGVNTIELNNGAKFDTNGSKEPTTGASILADGAFKPANGGAGAGGNGAQQQGAKPSSNTITGTSIDAGTITGNILAQNSGTNTITLTGLKVNGDLEAGPGGSNIITLTNGYLTNIRTKGVGSKNTVTLNGDATIKGFITNSETVLDTEGSNTIVLNDTSHLDLHSKHGNGAGNTDDSAIFTSKKTQNTISGNSTGSHQITGNITAKSEGKNTITLTTLSMTGNINTDGGVNEINLGVVGNKNQSTIKGQIIAQNGDFDPKGQANGAGINKAKKGLNQMELLNVKIDGGVEAKSKGQNVLNLRDVDVTGDITAENEGNNHLALGNGGLEARIKGSIKAKTNGTNTIEFNNGYSNGGVFAEGKDAKNTITLGNATYTGKVKSNITATDSGENDISIQSVNLTGSIIAQKQGKNTITDKNPFNAPSKIEGGIVAKDHGTNTATLKNITITEGITAEGEQAKNTLTLGDKQDGVITSNITAKANGANDVTFKDHLSLFGDITAEKGGKNTVKEDQATKTQSFIQGQILADGGENTITLANTRIVNGITAKGTGAKNTIAISTTDNTAALYANLTATDGGANTATLGGNGAAQRPPAQNQSGILDGSVKAEGNGSQNTLTLNNSSILRNGAITADASKNTGNGTTTNTITLNNTSSIALQAPVNDGILGYAVYANGKGAKNTIEDKNGGAKNTINGFIVADSGKDENNQNATKAQNEITLKDLTLTGDINAYNGGDNTLKLTTASLTGNVLAQIKATNNIEFQDNAKATMKGTFAVDGGGVNTVTLKNGATFDIASDNNAQAFQATGDGSKNIFREVNANGNTSGSITGDIFATRKAENEIKVRALSIDGNVTAWGGTNTIEIGNNGGNNQGTAPKPGLLKGHIAASSAPTLEFGNMDSKNAITLNGSASIEGSIEAQGTTAEMKARNEVTLNNTSKLTLKGTAITDNQGAALGTGNDAIFSETLQAYNKIDDKGSGESSITGNIYAKNNSVDPGQIKNIDSGNDITLKKVNMTGSIIADASGKNVIKFGEEGASLVGDISAKEQGTNTITFGATGKTSSIQGNISATDTATNTLTLTDTSVNKTDGANYSILATTKNAAATSNAFTLNGSSSISNTAILATQTATAGIAKGDDSAKNTLTLGGSSSLHLVANPAGEDPAAAILAKGLYANNKIEDNATLNNGATNNISGDIRADGENASNDITLKKIAMTGGIIADNKAKNTINFASASGSLTGNITASNSSSNTITFGQTPAQQPATTATIDGNVTASSISSNIITLNSTTMNAQAGRNYLILASATEQDTGTTQNTITLNGASSIQNTAISATQQVQIGPNANITDKTPTKNDVKLEGSSFLSLVANAANAATGGDGVDYAGGAALLASGLYAQNTITDNATGSNIITGDIVANYGAAKNTITLKKIAMTGNIIADNNASNHITFGNGTKDSGTFYGDIAAYTRNSESKNEVTFSGMKIGGDEVRGIIATNDAQKDGGVNAISLDKESSLSNMYMKSTGLKSNNKITLKDDKSSIALKANNEDGNAMYAKDEHSSNTIEMANGISSTANHSITGNITAEEKGSNTITLANLNIDGSISATNATNTVKITTKGEIKNAAITATNAGSNTLENLKETSLSGSLIKAANKDSKNTISFEEKYAISLTAVDGDAILADDSGINTIKGGKEAVNNTSNTIIGNITASNSGKNEITLNSLILTGDINASNKGTNNLTFGEDQKTTKITGNTTATDATNTIKITAGTQEGNINALQSDASNTISYDKASELKNSIILAQGAEVKNELTLKDNAKITGSSLQAIKEGEALKASRDGQAAAPGQDTTQDGTQGGQADAGQGGGDVNGGDAGNVGAGDTVTPPAPKVATAANIVAFEGQDGSFAFVNSKDERNSAVYAQGEGASNVVKAHKGTITGNIIARDGGKNTLTEVVNLSIDSGYVEADGNSALNDIKIDNSTAQAGTPPATGNSMKLTANPITGAAITATTAQNKINLILGEHSITGNITSYDGGKNDITYSLGNGGQNQGNTATEGLKITGDLYSSGDAAQNNLTLEGGSKLESKSVISKDAATNTIKFQNDNNGTGTNKSSGTFTITNTDGTQALLASGWKATNTFENSNETNASTISGDIISLDGGINMLEKVAYLTIKDGSVQAKGDSSTNSIIVTDKSSVTLKSDSAKNAVYATGFEAKNTIKDNGTSSVQNAITGNINADNGGQNTITLKNLQTTGNLIATDAGTNTITIGEVQGTGAGAGGAGAGGVGGGVGGGTGGTAAPSSSFAGALSASGTDAANTLTIGKDVSLTLSKDETTNNNVIYVSGTNAKNTVTDNSGKETKITGDIRAEGKGGNTITIGQATFAGDVYALSGGTNTVTFAKGSVAAKDPTATGVLTQKITADGANSINILNYNDTNFASGVMVADHGGENRLFLKLPQNAGTGQGGQGTGQANAADPLRLDITTGMDANNKAVAEGVSAAEARVTYTGGDTTVVFSQTKSSGNNTGGDITATAYSDGVLLTLDANSANDIFKDFRDLQSFFTNLATTYMKDKTRYSVSGNYVGAMNFLKESGNQNQAVTLDLEKNSSLIAKIYTNSTGSLTLNMKQGSKWVVTPTTAGSGVVLEKLSGDSLENKRADVKDTLREQTTIIDLATGGYATKYGVYKNEHTALTLNNVEKLDGANFRVFADIINRKSDTIHVLKAGNGNGNGNQKDIYLQAYYTADSLRKAMDYSYDDTNSTNNTLVASVDTSAKTNFGFNISEPSTVEQGYLLVTTEFIKKEEDKTPLAGTTNGTTGKVDNYYIKGYSAKIKPKEVDNSYGIVSVNYLVWLANTNNINKRLGEVRDASYGHGLWVRGYGGQIVQDQGIAVTNNYISTQLGYDFGLPMRNGMHIIGFAFGYGSNDLKSSNWKMQSTYLSGGMYYSYVKDSGFYSDTIGRYDYIDTTPLGIDDFKSHMISSVITLSQEFGYRAYFDTKKRFFFEGQLEAVGGYMKGSSILQTRSSLADAQIKSSMPNSFVFRGIAGGVLGYRIKSRKNQTDLRLGASYVADYALGKMELDVGDGIAKDSRPLGFNQMVMASLGVNTMLTEHLRMYFDFEMGFMGKRINQNYLANVGIRYSFGTKRRESTFGEVSTEESADFKTLNIEAPKVKCAGCNPESGFYLEVVKLPSPNAGVANHLARSGNYRTHTSQDGQATYYVGPFKSLKEAKAKQPEIDKIVQTLMRNPSASAGIYKINNKAKN